MATRDYPKDEVIQIVVDAAQARGIPKDDFLRASYIETGGRFDERAYNSGSGAAGLFQFIPSTASAYGIRGNEFDPAVSADAAARLYLDNQRTIVSGHNRTGNPYLSGAAQPGGLDMYVAHQQGAGGYASIQSALANGSFSRDDTRRNILSNISARDAQALTGHSLDELRTMPDRDLARSFVDYWQTKYDRIAIPSQGIEPRDAGNSVDPTQPGTATVVAQPVLRQGSEGADVERLQQAMVDRGITGPQGRALAVDGDFGPATDAAIKRFQARVGLEADGVVGKDTWGALNDPALQDGMLRVNERGAAVERLQQRLIEAGIGDVQGRPLETDGRFGPQTRLAVEAYQRQHGLNPDGIAGPATLDQLAGLPSRQTTAPTGNLRDGEGGVRWPAPGNTEINEKDKAGEGGGEFGTRRGDGSRTHKGIDIQGRVGDPVVAYQSGRVIFSGQQSGGGGYGNYVVVEHPDRTQTLYAHLDSRAVREGETVEAGQHLGAMGRSGNVPRAGDTHLHFELRENATPGVKLSGTAVDPTGRFQQIAPERPTPVAPVPAPVHPAGAAIPAAWQFQRDAISQSIGPKLAEQGYNPAQIGSISSATAVMTVKDGEVASRDTRYYVSNDGQRVAALYGSGVMREVDISQALLRTGAEHLELQVADVARNGQQPQPSTNATLRNNDALLMGAETTGRSMV